MDLKDTLTQLSERINKQKDSITTEEATKTAFIMPWIAALGYDIFNPFEVIPELDCDLIKKKGDKIDYAIKKDGDTILLIECKHCSQDLNLHDTQLKKYFVASNARFGVLTNGIEYRFYTDLDKTNIMDDKPFMVINMLELTENEIEQLKKFHKSYYDEEKILSTAQELKYTTELKNYINSEFNNPSANFVKFITKQIYEGMVNQRIIDLFTPLIKKAIQNIINDTISERLELAIKTTKDEDVQSETTEDVISENNLPEGIVFIDEERGIVTTQEEIDSYLIVKAILASEIDINRIFYRDAQSYFSILLDNNNRKAICRMFFNGKTKFIRIITAQDREGVKYTIDNLNDIYKYGNELREALKIYL